MLGSKFLFAALCAFPLAGCPGSEPSPAGSLNPGRDGNDDTTNGSTGADDGDATDVPESDDDLTAGGLDVGDEALGGGDEATGEPGEGEGTGGAPAQPCSLFHDGWAYGVATYYEPGEEPIVVSVSGTARFAADDTYEQNYRIGGISNIYSGSYAVDGDRLMTFDEAGDPVFDYRFTCSDELRELVLILENEDGTPSIIYGLESLVN